MKSLLKAALLATLLAASACATAIPWDGETASLRVGMSQAQVQAAFGAPNRTSIDADGLSVWSYDRPGPSSATTSSGAELTVKFLGEFVTHYSHSTSTTTTTTTAN